MYNRIGDRRVKKIVYAGIWERETVIAEHKMPGNMQEVVRKLVQDGVRPDTRASYNYENAYHAHLYNINNRTYVVIVESGYSKKLSYEMIEEMRDLRYPSDSELELLTKKYMNNQNEDKICRINNQVNEINEIVVANIQKVLKNTTKLEVLAKKTEELENRTLMFKKEANTFLSLARCQNIKWTIICSCAGICLVGVLGFAFYWAVKD
jgi:hypothetical protein